MGIVKIIAKLFLAANFWRLSNTHNDRDYYRAFHSALEKELRDGVGEIFARVVEVGCARIA